MIDVFTAWLVTWSPLFIALVFFWVIWHIVIFAFKGGY